jgi:hypothetical protein
MLVAVERKPTMAHGGYDGGGQCLLQFFFFFPVQRHQPLFSFLVCFFLVLLLLISGVSFCQLFVILFSFCLWFSLLNARFILK